MQSASKPLLLVISQTYVPDPASVGQHMADAAEALAARGHDVRVLTSSRGYENPKQKYQGRERRAGVDIRRLPFSSFGKRSLVHRILGQSLFVLQVILRGLFARRLAGVLVSTSPPMGSFAAVVVGLVRRVPITYWLMDLNPDQAIALGKVSPRSPLAGCLRWLNRRVFHRAAAVVVLDRFMAERVRRQYEVGGRMEIVPPWPHVDVCEQGAGSKEPGKDGETRRQGDTVSEDKETRRQGDTVREDKEIRRPGDEENPFVAEHGLAGRFVVMYSGNHSPASPVTTLVQAALAMRDDARFVFVFVGGGLGKREVDEAIEAHRPANIVSLPYQPLERIKYSLSAADLHVVTLGSEMAGIIHPCKIYGAMAVGRPVLLIGPRPSHAADLIDRHAIGWQVDQGDVASTVATLRRVGAMPPDELAEMGGRARAAVRERYGKRELCEEFCEVVERSMRPARSPHECSVVFEAEPSNGC